MTSTIDRAAIERVLATIPDPEFGLSITDLGLIYDVRIEEPAVTVQMTLTSPGCPAGGMIVDGVHAAVSAVPGVERVQVDVVWDPAWTPARLTPAAREHLGWPAEEEPPAE
jgi:metal-sulfur cluster biosynthetic enzyme